MTQETSRHRHFRVRAWNPPEPRDDIEATTKDTPEWAFHCGCRSFHSSCFIPALARLAVVLAVTMLEEGRNTC